MNNSYKLYYIEKNKEKYNDSVMPKMWEILEEVFHKIAVGDDQIAYLGLYGSQNYRIDNKDSDIDCECFIFPWDVDILYGHPFFSTCITTKYGTCHVKDIRMAFKELLKSSPNILEVFATPYAIINKDYEFIINKICNEHINSFANLSRPKLVKGLEGLLKRYSKSIDTSYKYFANVLRISDMIQKVIDGKEYLDILVPQNYEELRFTKQRLGPVDEESLRWFSKLQSCRNLIINEFYEKNSFTPDRDILDTIEYWESQLMIKYIRLRF